MGHLGLTPQSATMLGGFRAQGRTAEKARRLLEDALALEAAGCFSIVLEAVPAQVAARITEALAVPTIGIGSGRACDGQVLVFHDLLGLYEGKAPRFVKRYADLYAEDVETVDAAWAAFATDTSGLGEAVAPEVRGVAPDRSGQDDLDAFAHRYQPRRRLVDDVAPVLLHGQLARLHTIV